MVARKRPSKPDPTKLTLSEIMAAIEQLFVREKYDVYMALRRDSALREYRALMRKQREGIREQTDHKRRRAA
jgi:hypothetical protein